jgi:hypothetical protein
MYVKEVATVAKFAQDDQKLVLPRHDPGIGRSGVKELSADRTRGVCLELSNDRCRDFTETVDVGLHLRRPARLGKLVLESL